MRLVVVVGLLLLGAKIANELLTPGSELRSFIVKAGE